MRQHVLLTASTCPLTPSAQGNSFTYRFRASPAGTHAYHAHHGLERPDGAFGALIVHPRVRRVHVCMYACVCVCVRVCVCARARVCVRRVHECMCICMFACGCLCVCLHLRPSLSKFKLAHTAAQNETAYPCDPGHTLTMIFSDWMHQNNVDVYIERLGPGFFPDGPNHMPFSWSRSYVRACVCVCVCVCV